MLGWMKIGIASLGAVALVAAGASAIGSVAWNRSTHRLLERLEGSTEPAPIGGGYHPDELAGLPAPVVRYFQFALTPGQPLVRSAVVRHTGEFRGSLDAAWSPFTSTQHFSVDPAGFVWDARIRMAPLVHVRVRDHYLGGRAGMLGKVAALVPVVDAQSTPALASGALHRYFAEQVWLPTSLLPREGVRWEPIDDSTARAQFTDSGISLTLDAHFGPAGEIERVEMLRYRDAEGGPVLTPFVGHFRDYARVEGMMVPMEASVEWVLPEGRLDYWRARITGIEYISVGRGVAPRRGRSRRTSRTG